MGGAGGTGVARDWNGGGVKVGRGSGRSTTGMGAGDGLWSPGPRASARRPWMVGADETATASGFSTGSG